LPEGRWKNQTHQAFEQILVSVQKREIFYGFKDFRSSLKPGFKAFCETTPVFEIGGNISSPELDEGSQTENAAKRIFHEMGIHKRISMVRRLIAKSQ
jgi:hypothetical protein